MQLIKLADK